MLPLPEEDNGWGCFPGGIDFEGGWGGNDNDDDDAAAAAVTITGGCFNGGCCCCANAGKNGERAGLMARRDPACSKGEMDGVEILIFDGD